MKYCIKDQLDLFAFHDSAFSLVSFDRKDMVVSVKHLNIHKNAEENPYDCDMEISLAMISLQNVHILSFEPLPKYQVDDYGNWHSDEPQIIFTGKDAEENFIRELKNGFSINCIDIRPFGYHTTIEISTCTPNCFFAAFSYFNVTVEWDTYCGKAWYERHK